MKEVQNGGEDEDLGSGPGQADTEPDIRWAFGLFPFCLRPGMVM